MHHRHPAFYILLTSLLGLCLVALNGPGARAQSRSPRLTKEGQIDLDELRKLHQLKHQQNQDKVQISDIVPTNLRPSSNSSYVAKKILGHSSKQLIDSEQFENLPLIEKTRKFDQQLEAQLNSSLSQPSSGKKADSSLKVELRAAQTKAAIRYKGFMDTTVSYQLYNQAFQAETTKTLNEGLEMVYEHLDSREEKTDRLSLRWSW